MIRSREPAGVAATRRRATALAARRMVVSQFEAFRARHGLKAVGPHFKPGHHRLRNVRPVSAGRLNLLARV